MINFNDCVEFIKKAIEVKDYTISLDCYKNVEDNMNFTEIEIYTVDETKHFYSKTYIKLIFDWIGQELAIIGNQGACTKISHTYSDRDKLIIDNLILDIKEMNEQKAISQFNHFFDEKKDSLKDINDLEDEED